jgi:propanediol dehydratase large subunit
MTQQTPTNPPRSRRFERRAERPVNKDSFVQEEADLGLVVMDSPHDPKPSIRILRGKIAELDGRSEDQFDLIDKYIARYAIDVNEAEAAMAMDSLAIARMLVESDWSPFSQAARPPSSARSSAI